jgi:YfiH family protein
VPGRTARADDLPVVAVDLGPGVRAAFTSRAGGVSRPPYDALNLGAAVGDEPAAVAENRLRVERWAGAPLVVATQVHGARAVRVDPEHREPGEADALVTTSPDVAVAVYVADCVPVLLADAQARVVAAVHVGRAGLVAGVLQSAVAAMVAAGADPSRLRAAAGPSIAGASYEVPAAMRDEVAAVVPATAATTAWGTPALDLPAGVVAVLRELGVADVHVDGRDTFRDPALFSHRRSAGTGRFAGVVRLV